LTCLSLEGIFVFLFCRKCSAVKTPSCLQVHKSVY
jgi:hypothetical protein